MKTSQTAIMLIFPEAHALNKRPQTSCSTLNIFLVIVTIKIRAHRTKSSSVLHFVSVITEEHGNVFDNTDLGRIHGPKRGNVVGGGKKCITNGNLICTLSRESSCSAIKSKRMKHIEQHCTYEGDEKSTPTFTRTP